MHIIPERIVKDPDDVKDYRWNFAAWLAEGETIAEKEILIDDVSGDPITFSNLINTDTDVTVRLSGGTAETSARVTCRITTSTGQIANATPEFDVRRL